MKQPLHIEQSGVVGGALYMDDDLGNHPMFPGGFINFGYWQGIDTDTHIKYSARIISQAQLYEQVLDSVDVQPGDSLVEVGCGHGNGARIAIYDYRAGQVYGIDASDQQAARSQNKIKGNLSGRLFFQQGTAESLPFAEETVDGIYSVEAIQHFNSVPDFFRSAHSILKPAGRLALCTFYATDKQYISELADTIPTYRDGLDNILEQEELQSSLISSGFSEVRLRSIGEYVWRGFDRWMHQVRPEDRWPDAEQWLAAYNAGKLDYGILSATK